MTDSKMTAEVVLPDELQKEPRATHQLAMVGVAVLVVMIVVVIATVIATVIVVAVVTMIPEMILVMAFDAARQRQESRQGHRNGQCGNDEWASLHMLISSNLHSRNKKKPTQPNPRGLGIHLRRLTR
jgi:hypothetical protein